MEEVCEGLDLAKVAAEEGAAFELYTGEAEKKVETNGEKEKEKNGEKEKEKNGEKEKEEKSDKSDKNGKK